MAVTYARTCSKLTGLPGLLQTVGIVVGFFFGGVSRASETVAWWVTTWVSDC